MQIAIHPLLTRLVFDDAAIDKLAKLAHGRCYFGERPCNTPAFLLHHPEPNSQKFFHSSLTNVFEQWCVSNSTLV